MQGAVKCRFYKQGQPNSCKNAEKCTYAHERAAHKPHKQPSKQQKHAPAQPREKEEIKDPETKAKILYITKLIDSLKQPCLKCNSLHHLVITSCGCQSVCKQCVGESPNCPSCKQAIDTKLFISA